MDLLTPGTGLIIWQLLVVLSIALAALAWVKILLHEKMGTNTKLVWLVATALLPLAGPLLFFFAAARQQ
jgi:hypothetical protein